MERSKNINIQWHWAFADTWVYVIDSNGCDVQVAVDELIEDDPGDPDNYVRVCYYGRHWWIPRGMHFPL